MHIDEKDRWTARLKIENERLKAQRDRLAIDHRTILSARMPTGFADTALAERFGLRIVGGQVEEIRE